jgi:HSP90 family molecular chaperone
MSAPFFLTAGTSTDKSIPVRITYKIIELFSEGLYSSPTKAVEELVSNSFDAGAQNVHVILSADLTDPGATIVVIDDGVGMDRAGLEQHWVIGNSNKRDATYVAPKGRLSWS